MRTRSPVLVVLAIAVGACSQGDINVAIPNNLGPGDIVRGAQVFEGTCAACHGGDAGGIDGLGKPLAGSEFVAASTELGLANFIRTGRPKDDPANTTGTEMPPSGGNPKLAEQHLRDVAAFLLSLN